MSPTLRERQEARPAVVWTRDKNNAFYTEAVWPFFAHGESKHMAVIGTLVIAQGFVE